MFLPQHKENRKELNSKRAPEKQTTASTEQQQNKEQQGMKRFMHRKNSKCKGEVYREIWKPEGILETSFYGMSGFT